MPWTDEMVETLKKMWNEGLSTGEIGKRLGVSKNSIVGKVHRLQLTARPSPIKKKNSEEAVSTPPKVKEKKINKTETSESENKEKTCSQDITASKDSKKIKNKVAPKAENNTSLEKATPKESEAFLNISIPVINTPKKPGDKITVTDLDNHTCRWPIGDPKDENFHFCGAPIRIGQTYCEEHAAIAYVKNIKK